MKRAANDLILFHNIISYHIIYHVKTRLRPVLLFSVAFWPAGSNEFDIADLARE